MWSIVASRSNKSNDFFFSCLTMIYSSISNFITNWKKTSINKAEQPHPGVDLSFYVLEHENINFINTDIGYGFYGLIIPLCQRNRISRFPAEVICKIQAQDDITSTNNMGVNKSTANVIPTSLIQWKPLYHWFNLYEFLKIKEYIQWASLPKIVLEEVGWGVDKKLRPR